MPRYISFFDLDHTLLNSNSSYKFGFYLHKIGYLSSARAAILVLFYALHKMGLYSVSSIHAKSFALLFKGKQIKEINRHIQNFLKENLHLMLNPLVIKELESARQKGHHTVILSSSPSILVEKIAETLKVNESRGTDYVVDDAGTFISINTIIEGKQKAKEVDQITKKHSVLQEKTFGYSDSYLDILFLRSVGSATVVNPNSKLLKISQEEGWGLLIK